MINPFRRRRTRDDYTLTPTLDAQNLDDGFAAEWVDPFEVHVEQAMRIANEDRA